MGLRQHKNQFDEVVFCLKSLFGKKSVADNRKTRWQMNKGFANNLF